MMSDTLNIESQNGDFVQILNCTRSPWICISTVGCQPGKINVFDSMRTGDISYCELVVYNCISRCPATT